MTENCQDNGCLFIKGQAPEDKAWKYEQQDTCLTFQGSIPQSPGWNKQRSSEGGSQGWPKIWMTMQVSDRSQPRPALLHSQWGKDYSPRLRNAERVSLAHECTWSEAQVRLVRARHWCTKVLKKAKHVWYFRLWGCKNLD